MGKQKTNDGGAVRRADGLWIGPVRIYWHGFSWYLWKPSVSDWRPKHRVIAWQWFGLEIDWIDDPEFAARAKTPEGNPMSKIIKE